MGAFMSNVSLGYMQTNPDFESDPIWKEHYPLIKYPEKEKWLESIRGKKSFTLSEMHDLTVVYSNNIRNYYNQCGYPPNTYIILVSDEDKKRYEQDCNNDLLHFVKLLTFFAQKCVKECLNIPPHVADCRLLISDEPHIDVSIREVCKMIWDIRILNEARESFEKHVEDQTTS